MAVPNINAKGRFSLQLPFVAKPTVVYTVIAIREIADLYLKGDDVYRLYYESVGLINGVNVNGVVFNYEDEVKLKPLIVTLEGTDGTITYVPSTYILTYPISGSVLYSRLILSVDLGGIPDTVPLDSILVDIENMVESKFGVKSIVRVNRSYSEQQPSDSEHALLEASRLGSIESNSNNLSDNIRLKNELVDAYAKIDLMTQILLENNLI